MCLGDYCMLPCQGMYGMVSLPGQHYDRSNPLFWCRKIEEGSYAKTLHCQHFPWIPNDNHWMRSTKSYSTLCSEQQWLLHVGLDLFGFFFTCVDTHLQWWGARAHCSGSTEGALIDILTIVRRSSVARVTGTKMTSNCSTQAKGDIVRRTTSSLLSYDFSHLLSTPKHTHLCSEWVRSSFNRYPGSYHIISNVSMNIGLRARCLLGWNLVYS